MAPTPTPAKNLEHELKSQPCGPRLDQRNLPTNQQHWNGIGAHLEYDAEAEDTDRHHERPATADGVSSRRAKQGAESGSGTEDGNDDGSLGGCKGRRARIIDEAGAELFRESIHG